MAKHKALLIIALFAITFLAVNVSAYNLTVTSSGNGSASGSASNVSAGSVKSISATANSGYIFMSWTLNSGSCVISDPYSSSTTVTVNGDCYIEPYFDTTQSGSSYSVSVTAYEGGTATGSASNIPYNGTVKISATPNSGYIFKNWVTGVTASPCIFASNHNSNSSTLNPEHVIIRGDCGVQASFEKTIFSIDTSVSPSGYGGTISGQTSNIPKGSTVQLTAIPNSGWEVTNWGYSGGAAYGCSISNVSADKTTANITVYGDYCSITVNFSGITLTVNTGTGGGVVSGSSTLVAKGSVKQISATPSSGYKFANWSNSLQCIIADKNSASTTVTVNGSCTVTANFSQTGYSFAVVSNNSLYGTVSNSASNVPAGTVKTITATPNSGYKFDSWSSNSASCTIASVSSASTSVTVNANCTVTANFSSIATTYNLTVFGSPYAGGSASGSASGISAGTVKNVNAIPAANYAASGWTSSNNTNCPISNVSTDKKTANVAVNADCTVTANFSQIINTYSLTVQSNNPSYGTVSGSASNVSLGSSKAVSATPNSGYKFDSWSSNSSSCTVANVSATSTTVTVNANCTINASFSANPTTYNLTVSAGSGGTAAGSASNVSAGSVKTISATPNSGYSFLSWGVSGSCTVTNSSAASTSVTVNGDCTVTANFSSTAATYNLTVQSNNLVYGSVSPSGVSTRTVGEIVSLTATPVQSDIGVLSWISSSTNCVISAVSTEKTTAKVTVNGNCTVTANFYAVYGAQYVLQVESNNTSYGKTSPTANSLRKAHEVVNLTATPTNSSYKFDNWKTTDTLSCPILDAKSATTSVTVKTNCTVIANFSPNSTCGNGLIDSGEDCDGGNLNGKDCSKLNYRSGCDGRGNCSTLSCVSCKFDTSACLGGNLTVKLRDAPYGTVTGSVSNAAFETNLPITATPLPGYKFTAWILKYVPWVSVENANAANTNAQLHAVNGEYNGTVEAAFVSCNSTDPDCAKAEICNNSIDDDGDGKIDCLDSDCASASNCKSSRKKPGAPTISIVKSG